MLTWKKTALTWPQAAPADGLGARQRGVGGYVLEEHLRELAGGVVRHVPVHAVAVGHLLPSAECRVSDKVLPDLQGPRTFRTRKLSGCPYIQML
jgi:hypothetical protein